MSLPRNRQPRRCREGGGFNRRCDRSGAKPDECFLCGGAGRVGPHSAHLFELPFALYDEGPFAGRTPRMRANGSAPFKLGWKAVKSGSDFEKIVPPQRTPIIIVSYKRSKLNWRKQLQERMRR